MIVKCVSVRSFESQANGDRILASYRESGVEAVELVLSDHGMFALDAPREDFQAVLAQLKRYGLSVASLTSDLYQQYHFASPEEPCRHKAEQITGELLERAAWLECPVIRIDAARTQGAAAVGYEQALTAVFDGLQRWIELAEKSGLKLACRASSSDFLRSPVEARDLIDRLNSPAIGVSLRVDDLRGMADLEDWIASLSYRLHCVVLGEQHFRTAPSASDGQARPEGEGPRIVTLLDQLGFGGPVVYEFEAESDCCLDVLSAFACRS